MGWRVIRTDSMSPERKKNYEFSNYKDRRLRKASIIVGLELSGGEALGKSIFPLWMFPPFLSGDVGGLTAAG